MSDDGLAELDRIRNDWEMAIASGDDDEAAELAMQFYALHAEVFPELACQTTTMRSMLAWQRELELDESEYVTPDDESGDNDA